MSLSKIVGKLLFFYLSCSSTFAIPVSEVLRDVEDSENITYSIMTRGDGSSKSSPVDASFDISGWENIAEENCYIMLCLMDGNRVFQRGPTAGASKSQRTKSGANLEPFHADQLSSRHTAQISGSTISAEEFPWASTQNGGENAYLCPATEAEQNAQKTGISAGFNVKGGPGYDQWFRVSFHGGTQGKFCTALFKNPPDKSVCGNDEKTTIFGVASVILANFVYQIVRNQGQPYFFRHASGSHKGSKRTLEVDEMVYEDLVVRHPHAALAQQ
ncbi:hypothetical protein F4777DRAFT_584136 [Nemania sp. FL0916]|nr:hypothetical protein F4777DRAFT_584136 [Nemania sp. FL0916]